MKTIFMKTEKSKTSEAHKFVPNFSQRLDLHVEKYKKTI